MPAKAKATGFEYLTKRSDAYLIDLLWAINKTLFKRHGEDPSEEQEITGLETLTSACQELDDELP